jgi:fatty-acyl-CoA synthase
LTAAVRRAVVEQHDATIGALKLVPAGAIPKTTSGKKRRAACRETWFAET